jgi:hypothetical protein
MRGGEGNPHEVLLANSKVPNLCIPHAFFEGKKAWETYARKSTSRTLK